MRYLKRRIGSEASGVLRIIGLKFINWYFWKFTGENPFGHSSMNLGSLYKGLVRDSFKSFKHLRVTKHTHDPLDDAKGNAEAMLAMIEQYNLKVKL